MQKPVIGRTAGQRQPVIGRTWHAGVSGAQEAHGADPVVHRDHDDVAPLRQLLAIVQRLPEDRHVVRGPQQEGPPEEVDHHGEARGHWGGRGTTIIFIITIIICVYPNKDLRRRFEVLFAGPLSSAERAVSALCGRRQQPDLGRTSLNAPLALMSP
ncbi:hypothetical protein EYF80_051394 [Liparis tanakae]|uniref:Uncharacterized protein n=1 Tax=Liparis tanakae TaxID=230148 RepID=A0A4Z2FB89_9TELE|nr:hypothetical protein EYF80_051394 [Liparis tanakae]